MNRPDYQSVGKSVRKKDSLQLLLGKPVFTEDIAPDALVVKLLRSPHANAIVEDIDTSKAKKIASVVDVFTWEDVPGDRFSNAGQTYPETSPYDRLIIDRHVRYVGDVVAIVAAESEKAAEAALSRIKVTYEVLDPVLDFRAAKDNPTLVHPEDNWHMLCDLGGDNERNLVGTTADADGDVEAVFADCDIVLERTYHTKAFNQAMMETFRTYTELDRYGRLHVISSTQIVFHVRRILSHALGIPKSRIRVEKPRIGGGFGAKQTAVCEVYPAFVTLKTGRPAMCVFTRKEAQTCGSPRHEMEIKVRLGANNDGRIRALDVTTLSNSGAYGEHGWATVGLTGHKSIPLYTGSLEAFKFTADVVYTNMQPSGAYRGFGATQGQFAVETAVNELAEMLRRDPIGLREQNMLREGMTMPAYFNEVANACALDRCLDRCRQMFDWEAKYPVRDMGNGKVRAAGVGMSMQGSGISGIDVGLGHRQAQRRRDVYADHRRGGHGHGLRHHSGPDGRRAYGMLGRRCLACSAPTLTRRPTTRAHTHLPPRMSPAWPVQKACAQLKERLCAIAAEALGVRRERAALRRRARGARSDGRGRFHFVDIADEKPVQATAWLPEATAMHSSPVSPPPFMVGMAEIELDRETGMVEVLNFAAVVDCGIPINPALARIQVEGGIVQGIGHTLMEDVTRTPKGAIRESSLFTYRLPTRLDVGDIRVEFEHSYEPTGPFGAKSIGEIVINTPAPAIAHAIYRATGVWHRELPILPEHILLAKPEAD